MGAPFSSEKLNNFPFPVCTSEQRLFHHETSISQNSRFTMRECEVKEAATLQEERLLNYTILFKSKVMFASTHTHTNQGYLVRMYAL